MSEFKSQAPVMVQGIPVHAPNQIAKHEGYHLSYKASSAGYGCPTTALVLHDCVFFVLCGDHKKEWGEATNLCGITGAIAYFMLHSAEAHAASEHLMAQGIKSDPFGLSATLTKLLSTDIIDKMRAHFAQGV